MHGNLLKGINNRVNAITRMVYGIGGTDYFYLKIKTAPKNAR